MADPLREAAEKALSRLQIIRTMAKTFKPGDDPEGIRGLAETSANDLNAALASHPVQGRGDEAAPTPGDSRLVSEASSSPDHLDTVTLWRWRRSLATGAPGPWNEGTGPTYPEPPSPDAIEVVTVPIPEPGKVVVVLDPESASLAADFLEAAVPVLGEKALRPAAALRSALSEGEEV